MLQFICQISHMYAFGATQSFWFEYGGFFFSFVWHWLTIYHPSNICKQTSFFVSDMELAKVWPSIFVLSFFSWLLQSSCVATWGSRERVDKEEDGGGSTSYERSRRLLTEQLWVATINMRFHEEFTVLMRAQSNRRWGWTSKLGVAILHAFFNYTCIRL